MIVEPKKCSYEDFPASGAETAGMLTLRTPVSETYTYLENVVYDEEDGMKLTLQIIKPSGAAHKPLPFIAYMQGSAWLPQQLYFNLPQLSAFARRGYVLAVVQYRPSKIAPFPAQVIDAKTAVKYLKRHAAVYGIDPDRGVLWGDSSGGHTAVMAGITGDAVFSSVKYPGVSSSVKAIVDFYGPTDVSKMCEEPSTMDHIGPDTPEGMLLGGVNVLENPQLVAPSVPMNYIEKDRSLPPVFIAHGNKDRLVPFKQSILLYEKLRDCGHTAEFYKVENADHSSGEFWGEPMFDLVDAFIKKYI